MALHRTAMRLGKALALAVCVPLVPVMTDRAPALQAATSCEALASIVIPNATVTSSRTIGANAFTPPDGSADGPLAGVPSFCRVTATLKPSGDSDIKVEVWLPMSGWNGKYLAVGNGAFNGSIAYAAMAQAVARGY